MLTSEEQWIIWNYALNHQGQLAAAEVYHKHIAAHVKSDRNQCPEMEFMSEVFNPCPDYRYKADLRKRILSRSAEGGFWNG